MFAYNVTNATTGKPEPDSGDDSLGIPDFWLGLMLAVGSSFFIGSSFILQKLGLRSSGQKEGATSASKYCIILV